MDNNQFKALKKYIQKVLRCTSPSITSRRLGVDPPCWHCPQLLCLLCLLPSSLTGVFLLLLLLSAGCCCLLRPATHAPILFRQDTNLQTLLALRSNLSGQGISCPMCSGQHLPAIPYPPPLGPNILFFYPPLHVRPSPAGVFMEKPHNLCTRTSSFKFSTHPQSASNVRRSSARPDASGNETSKTSSAPKPDTLSLSSSFLLIRCSFLLKSLYSQSTSLSWTWERPPPSTASP